jgi:hypothetical protein
MLSHRLKPEQSLTCPPTTGLCTAHKTPYVPLCVAAVAPRSIAGPLWDNLVSLDRVSANAQSGQPIWDAVSAVAYPSVNSIGPNIDSAVSGVVIDTGRGE